MCSDYGGSITGAANRPEFGLAQDTPGTLVARAGKCD
jgi:hypothetical protein